MWRYGPLTPVFPAYAGMILSAGDSKTKHLRVPRVCGDDPRKDRYDITVELVFPAYAGMIQPSRTFTLSKRTVFPAYAGMIPVLRLESPTYA